MERVIRLGVLNVVTQPHSAERYQRLIQKVRNRRKAGRIRGDRFGIIGLMSTNASPSKSGAYVQGMITTFTQIDVDGDWVNVSTGQKAEDDERSQIRIPEHLRPNPAYNHFRFYLKEHLLMFEIGNSGLRITPANANKLFARLFSADTIVSDFGEVTVTTWPSKGTLSAILKDAGLRILHLVIHAPNPDDGKAAETQWMKRLESIGARSIEQRVVAKKDESISPDGALIEAATVASTNGQVDATVRRGKRTVQISTRNSPLIHTHTYFSESNTEASEFGIACENVRHRLRSTK